MQKYELSEIWKPIKENKPFYSGGKIYVQEEGKKQICVFETQINIVDWETSSIINQQEQDKDDSISTYTACHNGKLIITSHMHSLMIRYWNMETKEMIKEIRYHEQPVQDMITDKKNRIQITCSVDKTVKVWDQNNNYCTHHYTKFPSLPMRIFLWEKDDSKSINEMQQFICCENGTLRVIDQNHTKRSGSGKYKDFNCHLSQITGILFPYDNTVSSVGITISRDKTYCVWDFKNMIMQHKIPTYEILESISWYDDTGKYFIIGGTNSMVSIWDIETNKVIQKVDVYDIGGTTTNTNDTEIVISSLYNIKNSIYVVTSNYSFIRYIKKDIVMNLDTIMIGYSDEIIDICGIENTKYAIIGTNSSEQKLLDTNTWKYKIFYGHTDVILSIDISPCKNFIVTSSKDTTIRIWYIIWDTNNINILNIRCVVIGNGHTEAVGCVCFNTKKICAIESIEIEKKSKKRRKFIDINDTIVSETKNIYSYEHLQQFCVSGSRDRTIKYWKLNFLQSLQDKKIIDKYNHKDKDILIVLNDEDKIIEYDIQYSKPLDIVSTYTVFGHDKDINTIKISPNDQYIATGSQDKDIKQWNTNKLKQYGTLSGHTRGIWDIKFSPIKKQLISTSSDKTIRLWSLQDLTCIKIFEGHSSPILRSIFLHAGQQILSVDSMGIMKQWNIDTNECINTYTSTHTGRQWGLSLLNDENILLTGGTDSIITIWEDVTRYENKIRQEEESKKILYEQKQINALYSKEYDTSFNLALQLAQPRRLQETITALVDNENRYKRWCELSHKRATAKANKSTEDEEEQEEEEEPWLITEARENQEQRVRKPTVTLKSLLCERSIEELQLLIKFTMEWNTNAKYAPTAQIILSILFSCLEPNILIQVIQNKTTFLALQQYSQRNLNRVDKMLRSSYILDYQIGASTGGMQYEYSSEISDSYDESDTSNSADEIVNSINESTKDKDDSNIFDTNDTTSLFEIDLASVK